MHELRCPAAEPPQAGTARCRWGDAAGCWPHILPGCSGGIWARVLFLPVAEAQQRINVNDYVGADSFWLERNTWV